MHLADSSSVGNIDRILDAAGDDNARVPCIIKVVCGPVAALRYWVDSGVGVIGGV